MRREARPWKVTMPTKTPITAATITTMKIATPPRPGLLTSFLQVGLQAGQPELAHRLGAAQVAHRVGLEAHADDQLHQRAVLEAELLLVDHHRVVVHRGLAAAAPRHDV